MKSTYNNIMDYIEQLKNKKITVMGLGLNRGGLGVTRFLAQSGAKVLVTDLKTEIELKNTLIELKEFDIDYVLGEHRLENFVQQDMIIQNPGVPHESKYLQIARENGIPIETDLSLFFKICPSRNFIAVGGTKGKSTVTDLIYHLFTNSKIDIVHAGNIGISVFDIFPDIRPETLVLLEISSWQLEGLLNSQFKPHVAVLTNILPDHLDRYPDFDHYANSEKLLCKHLSESDYLVTFFDNPITKNLSSEVKANIYWFSIRGEVKQGTFLINNKIYFRESNKTIEICQINDIPIPGEHNISNTMAAINATLIMNLPIADLKDGIQSFKGVPHRLEKVRSLNNLVFYNDTCATTPEATIAAIKSFHKTPMILILGGKNKKLQYFQLCKIIQNNSNIQQVIVLRHREYDASEIILAILTELGLKNKTYTSNNIEDAVQFAYQKAIPGTHILLSPSAASFGMFQNEFDRGNQFKRFVSTLT